MSSAFNLGRLFGIQFRLHYTWFIIFILVTVSFVYPDWSSLLYWIVAIITSLLFFASILAHELAHSLVGRANGIPIKSITLFIFGGVAQMTREARSAGAELKMAVAGPACSLVIAGLFYLVSFFTKNAVFPVATVAFEQLAYVNVALAAFNLIPGFPLDGGRVFRSVLWRITDNYRRSTRIATRVGQGTGYLFILGGILISFLQPFGLGWFSGLWLVFIGWFLERAASASYHQTQWSEVLQRFTASQVMTTDCPVVPLSITVSQLVQGYILTSGRSCFLVADEGEVRGILTLSNIKSVSQSNWGETQVKEIMTPVDKLRIAHPDQDALSVLEQMDESNINQMLVVGEGRGIGLVTRDNLIRLLRTRSELGI
ncbi:site-2 protease family protein [Chloroflexota bacterium]